MGQCLGPVSWAIGEVIHEKQSAGGIKGRAFGRPLLLVKNRPAGLFLENGTRKSNTCCRPALVVGSCPFEGYCDHGRDCGHDRDCDRAIVTAEQRH